jgi:DNA transformation protein and related proteins
MERQHRVYTDPMSWPALVEHCLELLSVLGPVRARRMFGGWGLHAGDVMVALIAFDRLYLKVDAETRAAFEQAGCAPFVYGGQARPVTLSYWTAPDDAMESPADMRPWAGLAHQAALRAALHPKRPAAKSRKPGKPRAAPRQRSSTVR